jgi:F420-dependent oxidoreductase-like protein
VHRASAKPRQADRVASTIRVAEGSLVVLVGPPGSGKSTWAASAFADHQVVSSDRLRALVGGSEHDQRASKDAFDVLDLVVERRLRRRLPTVDLCRRPRRRHRLGRRRGGLVRVVDSLALDPKWRRRLVAAAQRAGVPCVAMAFDEDPAVCRARNRQRERPVPAKTLSSMLDGWPGVRDGLTGEGFAAVHRPGPILVVAPDLVTAPAAATRQREDPMSLEFGLHIPRFSWPGGPAETHDRLGDVAAAAEEAGFTSLWVMDHMVQIPSVGRHWEDMLESFTTLGFLAGRTSSVRLGPLVAGITYRNIAHLAKIVATLDVLSGGRAVCGLGAAWYEREHRAYGWRFPAVDDRYAALEDALQLLPLMWGKGTPSFSGRTIEVPEAICHPRPLQDHVPVLVGGSGERRTLRLVARYADACNLFGDPAVVRHKVEVLRDHCLAEGREPDEVTVTHLSTADAPTLDDQVGRYRQLAEAGVRKAIVSLPDLSVVPAAAAAEPVTRFAPVMDAFRPRE